MTDEAKKESCWREKFVVKILLVVARIAGRGVLSEEILKEIEHIENCRI